MKKYLLIISLISVFFVMSACTQSESAKNQTSIDYTLTYSEGNCSTSSDCSYQGEGCGGGHGYCTSSTAKGSEPVFTTCEVVAKHPINNNYSCSCIESIGKCGWVK